MLYFVLSAFVLICISYMIGSLVLARINTKEVYFATPIGFFIMLCILQIFQYIAKFLNMTNQFMHVATFATFLIITIIFILNYKNFNEYLYNLTKHKFELLIAIVLVFIFLLLFANVDITLKTSDAIFYSNFVDSMINPSVVPPIYSTQYDYQVYYNLIASLKFMTSKLSYFGVYTDVLTFPYMSWVFSIVHYFIFSLTIVNISSVAYKKINNKFKSLSIILLVLTITSLNTWMIITPYFGNSIRRIAIAYLLFFILKYFDEKRKGVLLVILVLFQSVISLSSSGLFLSGMILYSFLLYSVFKKRKGFIKELAIISISPFIFAIIYIPKLLVPVILLYTIITLLEKFKRIQSVETIIFKYGRVILFLVPLCIIATNYIPFFSKIYENVKYSFSNRPSYDWVPDLLRFTGYGSSLSTIFYNGTFWIILGFVIAKLIKKFEFVPFFLLIVIITFFNPLVYDFVFTFLTNVVFFRITDLFYNPFILMYIFVSFSEKINNKVGIICIVLLNIFLIFCQINIFKFNVNFNELDDYNYIFHTTNKDISTFKLLDEYLIKNDFKDSYIFASQIYGTGMYSKMNIENEFNWQTQYLQDLNETNFTTVFFRREPNSDDYEVNYEKACELAYEKEIEYSIIDAQYNWKLEQGLWPCIEKVLEFENYRVFKMRYDLWDWNIKQGYITDTRGAN